MFIWNQPLDEVLTLKLFITPEEEKIITQLTMNFPNLTFFLSDDASFWENKDEEGLLNLQNALEG